MRLTPTAPEIISLKASFLTLNEMGGTLSSMVLNNCRKTVNIIAKTLNT